VYLPAANAVAIATNTTRAVYIDSSQNVGVGTSSPAYKLDVLVASDGTDAIVAQSNVNSGAVRLRPDGTNGNAIRWGGGGVNAGLLRFLGFSDAERMRIHASGGVSIGNTTDPGNTNLSVTGTGAFGGNISATASGATAVEGVFTNTNTGTTASAGVRGIANSTGFWLLRQYGTGVTATVFGQTLANYALLASSGASSNGLMLGSLTADPVIFGTNDVERARIHSSGGVSIGNTTDPGAANLNVSGSISGGYIAHAAGTTAMAFGADNVARVTPNANATYTTTVPAAGAICVLSILTSGTTSYTITFGSGFKSTGVLLTGIVSAMYFNITFVSDGTNLIETARTIAIA
jgi:hypothetical protein